MKKLIISSIILIKFCLVSQAQNIYFPPASPLNWDTLSPSSLNWCPNKIDSLYSYLEQRNTKGFIILKNGKIVLEKYFGTFNEDSLWYWASAGKTLTAFLTGIAQEQGAIHINDYVTQYLGSGWSSCTSPQEDSISIKHLLTMTSGLDDILLPCSNEDDTPPCLAFLDTAGTRWAYHTGAYRKLQDILPVATSSTLNGITNSSIKNKINMSSGFWVQDVYYSRTRDFARFGLLCLSKGIWGNDTILHDTSYFQAMTNTSQNYNLAYGYLTWLNGKNNFMLPGSQFVFNGFIAPSAPADMYAALGKNDQKIYVVPSQDLVVVRFGDAAYTTALSITVFDEELWQKINDLNCMVTNSNSQEMLNPVIFPNPFVDYIKLFNVQSTEPCILTDYTGKLIYEGTQLQKQNFSDLPVGLYFLKVTDANQVKYLKLIKA
jgi:CubicO group peptidase (beta-lactamase class C family)